MELREYQKEAVRSAVAFFRQDKIKGGLIILPTGSGKSLVIANIARFLEGNTIVFQPSKEILEQNLLKMKMYGIDDVGVYSASLGSKTTGKITFATIGSVINYENITDFHNIIIDECHLCNAKEGRYQDFISRCGGKVLGLTATPYRLSSFMGGSMLKFLTRTSPKVFSTVIYHKQIKDLFDDGYLAKLKYYQISIMDISKLKSNSSGSDYEDNSVREHQLDINYNQKIVEVIERLKPKRKKILVFTRFVEDAKTIAGAIGGAEYVSGETRKNERERILKEFSDMNSGLQVVVNCGVLTTGFDFPELDCVVLGRATMSLALYYQMVGRGIRIHKNKADTWIVDLAGTYQKFGKVEDLWLDSNGGVKRVVRKGIVGKQLTNILFN